MKIVGNIDEHRIIQERCEKVGKCEHCVLQPFCETIAEDIVSYKFKMKMNPFSYSYDDMGSVTYNWYNDELSSSSVTNYNFKKVTTHEKQRPLNLLQLNKIPTILINKQEG